MAIRIDVESVINALEDRDSSVVCTAVWLLGEMKHVAALSALRKVIRCGLPTIEVIKAFQAVTVKLEALK